MSPALENQMAEIESLVRRGIENNGSENDRVIQRTVDSLKDLGGQSGIENSAMRYVGSMQDGRGGIQITNVDADLLPPILQSRRI